MIGGAALLADGMITPPISVTSAIEGLRQLPVLDRYQRLDHCLYCSWHSYRVIFSAAIWYRFYREIVWTDHDGLVCDAGSDWVSAHIFDDWSDFQSIHPYYAIELANQLSEGFLDTWCCVSLYYRGRSIVF